MGVLEDILKALDRVEIWKEVQNTPQRVSALEKRIGALEEKLGGKWPADVCRYCGERGARLNHAIPCRGKTDVRAHKPSTR